MDFRKPKILFLAFAILLSIFSASFAVDDETEKRMFNELAYEAIECVSYFLITSEGFRNSPNLKGSEKGAQDYQKAADKLLMWAFALSKQAGLHPKTVESRLSLEMKDQMKRINNNTSNISILMADYLDSCTEVASDPEKRAELWLKRELESARQK